MPVKRPLGQPQDRGSWLAMSVAELARLRATGHEVKIHLDPLAPQQMKAVTRWEHEVFYGGGKVGGKTYAGEHWIVSGNPHLPNTNPDGTPNWVNRSYTYHPKFLGVVFRKNQKDLLNWIEEFKRVAEVYGGEYVKPVFRFPDSGAQIYLTHFEEEDAYMQFQGLNIVRVLGEEIGQIPDRRRFLLLRSCVRSMYPEMRAQLFLTANPGGPGACVPYGEVLTPDGWKDIRLFSPGDPVYTVDENGSLVATTVQQTHCSLYDGDLFNVKARGLSISCTPNHKIAKVNGVRGKGRGRAFTLVPASSLPGQATVLRSVHWEGTPISLFRLPMAQGIRHGSLEQPTTLLPEHFCELMGWFLSEGTLTESHGWFVICQVKQRQREDIERFLNSAGFKYKKTPREFIIHSRRWVEYLKQFGKQPVRYVPAEIKNATLEQLRIFMTAMMDGDGHWETRGKSGTYYTTSPRLADDMCEVFLKLGFVVYCSNRQRPSRRRGPAGGNDLRVYQVNFKPVKSGGTELLTGHHVYRVNTRTKRKSDVRMEPYSGPVYCLGVTGTHSFVIRQNGSVWVSGNSWVFDRYIEPKDKDGNLLLKPDGTPYMGEETIWEEAVNIITKKKEKISRIWIPSYAWHNPKVQNDPTYMLNLATMDEKDTRAYLLGDWTAFRGTYFDTFSKKEHVRPAASLEVKPWWRRAMALDWGRVHDSAAYWVALNPDTDQQVIYREFSVNMVDPVELGVHLARLTEPDLLSTASHTITMYLSHDAYRDTVGDMCIAEMIRKGMERILGKKAVHIPDLVIEKLKQRSMERGEVWNREVEDIIYNQHTAGIVFRVAPRNRSARFQWMRALMRVKPLLSIPRAPDYEVGRQIAAEQGAQQFFSYLRMFEAVEEVLPKLLVSDDCPKLIAAIPKAVHDDDKPEDVDQKHFYGMDSIDSCSYLLGGFREEIGVVPPAEIKMRKIEAFKKQHPGGDYHQLLWLNRGLEERARRDKAKNKMIQIPRSWKEAAEKRALANRRHLVQ